jgi:hypothetical protein
MSDPAPISAPVVPADPTPAPVADPTAVTPAAPAEPAAPAPAPSAPEPPKSGSEPSEAEKRIRQLVAKQREAERERDYYKGLAEGLKKPDQPPAPTVEVPPVADKFDSYDDYLVARAKYELKQDLKRASEQAAVDEGKKSQDEIDRKFMGRMQQAAETDPEIMEVLNDPNLPVSKNMVSAVKESEQAPAIIRYLAQNREEASKIFQLGPIAAAREIGKIEAKIMLAPKPAPPRTISQAPEPITPVTPAGPIETDLDKLPVEEFMNRRNQAQFKRR